jgi:hypothetical protein
MLIAVVSACGGGDGDAGVDGSGGAVDAGALDAGGVDARVDAGVADAGPALDPALCPVGPSDGCCPAALQYGGTDPDCPSLACDHLLLSDEIPLDDWDAEYDGDDGGVGMVWTGIDLALAWPRADPVMGPMVVFERRDLAGLVFGPVEHVDPDSRLGWAPARAELGFHPSSRAYLFVTDKAPDGRASLLLDEQGAPGQHATFGETCIPMRTPYAVYPAGDRFFVAQCDFPCEGGSSVRPRVDVMGLDGLVEATSIATTGSQTGIAYDAVDERVLFTYRDVDTLKARWWDGAWSDPTTLWQTQTQAIDETALAFDGTSYGIAWGLYVSVPGGWSSAPRFDVWTPGDPDVGAAEADLPAPPQHMMIPPRVVWTGDGWIAITTTFLWEDGGLPDSWTDFETRVWSLAPDGSLRESFPLDDDGPAYLVNARWAGGHVAITWVTASDEAGAIERHSLRWLSCPIE